MRKLALALALSTALFAAEDATITNKQAPKNDGVVTKKSDNVKLDYLEILGQNEKQEILVNFL